MATTTGHGHPTGYQRGCEACRREAREYKRGLRARNRGLEPEPALTVVEPVDPDPGVTETAAQPAPDGAVVAAVRADLATLGELRGYEWAAAAAIAMARILDHPGAVTTQPSAAKQLGATMEQLHRVAAPKGGRLRVVQKMSTRGPDAG